MSQEERITWQSIQDEVLRRIDERIWKPGEYIPHEAKLAEEFGCARTTVSRALRNLAEQGLLNRKRKAGTRVAIHPVRKAQLGIPIIRHEIEASGREYFYTLLSRKKQRPPVPIQARMRMKTRQAQLHVVGLHLADGIPYVHEDRWISLDSVPDAGMQEFTMLSPNEWLIQNIPFETGEITLSAVIASPEIADALQCHPEESVMVMDRVTRHEDEILTYVRLTFVPGYQMRMEI